MNSFKKINQQYIQLSFFLLLTIGIILLGHHSYPTDDDYSLAEFFIKNNPIEGAAHLYLTWGGQFSSWLSAGIAYLSISHVNLFSMMLAAMFVTFTIITVNFLPFKPDKPQYLLWSSMLAIFLIGFKAFLPSCVYWVAGGLAYIFPIMLGIIWCYLLKRSNQIKKIHLPLLIIFSLFLGCMSEQVSISLLWYGIFLVVKTFMDKKRYDSVFVAMIITVTIGTAVLIFAPGNAARANAVGQTLNFNPINIIENFLPVVSQTIDSTWKKSILFLIFGLVLGIRYRNSSNIFHKTNNIYWWSFFWIILFFISIFPFMIIGPRWIALRSLFIPVFALSFMSLGIGYFISMRFIKIGKPTITTYSLYILTLLAIGLVTKEHYIAFRFKNEFVAREKQYLSKRDSSKKVVIPALTSKQPSFLYFRDVTTDPKGWTNKAAAGCYGVKELSVIAD